MMWLRAGTTPNHEGPWTRGSRAIQATEMAVAALWRWVLLHLLRNPLVGFLSLLLIVGLPLLQALRPFPSEGPPLAWAFPAGLLGLSLGLSCLSHGEAFLVRLDPRTRWGGELGGLAAATLYLQLPILTGALLSGVRASDLGRSLPAILTSDLHL